MKVVVKTDTIDKVSSRYGISPEEYIAKAYKISCGSEVCAHSISTHVIGDRTVYTDEDL